MQWHSVDEFFAMGGYALYVWGSFGACALAMLIEPWLLRRRHRSLTPDRAGRDANRGTRARLRRVPSSPLATTVNTADGASCDSARERCVLGLFRANRFRANRDE